MSIDFGSDDLTTPDGFKLYVQAGWPTLFGALRAAAPLTPELDVNGMRLPSSFEMYVGQDDSSVWLFFTFEDNSEAQLTTAVSIDLDVDQAIDRIKQTRPILWWKRKAILTLIEQRLRQRAPEPRDDANLVESIQQTLGVRPKRTRQALTDELLREVARVYHEAFASGESPVVAVQHSTGKSYPTAARYVTEARARGFLFDREDGDIGEIRQHVTLEPLDASTADPEPKPTPLAHTRRTG